MRITAPVLSGNQAGPSHRDPGADRLEPRRRYTLQPDRIRFGRLMK